MNQKHDRYEVALTVALAERAVVKAASDRIFVEFAARVARDWGAIPLPPAAEARALIEARKALPGSAKVSLPGSKKGE